ncbi:MAG: glycoside hydrolase [Chlamydiales bacterium]|nr:glycoside hydrolase [Chlamydiales bacterium]
MRTSSLRCMLGATSLLLASMLPMPGFAKQHSSHETSSKKCHKKHARALTPVQVTGETRLPPTLDCLRLPYDPYTTTGLWDRNVTDECWIAVNPCDPCNLIITTHQDAYETGFLSDVYLYSKDGGKTWNHSDVTFSRCQGTTIPTADDDFQSASDPNVIFDYYGNAFAYTTSFNSTDPEPHTFDEANTYAKSEDGGQSWTRVFHTTRDDGNSRFLDRPLMTADPYRKDNIYALTVDIPYNAFLFDTNKSVFQKSTDGGNTWSPRIIAQDWGTTGWTWGDRVHVLPQKHHPLVTVTMLNFPGTPDPAVSHNVVAFRSDDVGDTWSTPTTIFANGIPAITVDPIDPTFTWRTFQVGVSSAINQKTGRMYAAWHDQLANPNGVGARIYLSMSKDGGKTWSSRPLTVNTSKSPVQQFLPALAVADDGTVGLLYYDFRNYKGTSVNDVLSTDVWLALYDKDLKLKEDVRLTPESFDLRQCFWSRETVRFPGDYMSLTSSGNNFHAAFVMTNPELNGMVNPNPFPLAEGELTILPPLDAEPQLVRQSTYYVQVQRGCDQPVCQQCVADKKCS